MSSINLPSVSRGMSNDDLADIVAKLIKEVQWLTDGNISSVNAREIGGWNVGMDSLASTSGNVGFSSAVTGGDDIRMWSGSADPLSASFQVYNSGLLHSSNIDVTGGVITGTTIQTAYSGARLVLSGNTLDAYDTSGISRIQFNPVGSGYYELWFRGESGQQVGMISGNNGQFNVASWNGATLVMGGWIDFSAGIVSGLSMSSVSGLQSALSGKANAGYETGYTYSGSHNHGIADGTILMTADGGGVTWAAYGGFGHSHTQQ